MGGLDIYRKSPTAREAGGLGKWSGRILNQHFTTGTGTSQPEGVVTGSTQGVKGTAGQTTTVTYEDRVDLAHSVDPDYRRNGEWMLHDCTLKAIKKLKDSYGNPLWASGLATRQPDTILGYPYVVNNDMPEMAASAKSILFVISRNTSFATFEPYNSCASARSTWIRCRSDSLRSRGTTAS